MSRGLRIAMAERFIVNFFCPTTGAKNKALFSTRAVTRIALTVADGVVNFRREVSYQPNSTSAALTVTISVVALFLDATS